MTIEEFQQNIKEIYYQKDSARGREGTFRWFVEEVGELARAIRKGEPAFLREEFSDCLAWLVSLASLYEVNMEDAAGKYAHGCPKCSSSPCHCASDRP